MKQHKETESLLEEVRIPSGQVELEGTLDLPDDCRRVVVFAHGSGSSRFSPRNRFVANELSGRAIGTLLLDLLTAEEDRVYRTRFDINLLATRLAYVTDWLNTRPELKTVSVGLFGASTGAAAALETAAQDGQRSAPSYRAEAVPIWPRSTCIWSAVLRCSLLADTIGKF